MRRVDAAQNLAFVEAEGDSVISLPLARRPGGPLPCQHRGQSFRVGHEAAVDRHVEGEQPGLVRQQLANGDPVFALLRELRPVRAHALVVVEPTPRVRERHRHGG